MLDLIKFAQGVVDLMWEPGEDGLRDLDNDAIQELAEECGIVCFRKPTISELNDPEWFGHEMGIQPGDISVAELTPEFAALVAKEVG
jgi:hypothetical protein